MSFRMTAAIPIPVSWNHMVIVVESWCVIRIINRKDPKCCARLITPPVWRGTPLSCQAHRPCIEPATYLLCMVLSDQPHCLKAVDENMWTQHTRYPWLSWLG